MRVSGKHLREEQSKFEIRNNDLKPKDQMAKTFKSHDFYTNKVYSFEFSVLKFVSYSEIRILYLREDKNGRSY